VSHPALARRSSPVAVLREFGVDHVQGFLIGRPKPLSPA